ncbi:hypothetical protein D3C87_2070200 [compost metagenome]
MVAIHGQEGNGRQEHEEHSEFGGLGPGIGIENHAHAKAHLERDHVAGHLNSE